MVHTTLPKVDKVDTSSTEVPTAQACLPDDNLADDDPDPLNFDMAESKIVCWMSSQL
jgi:hypothetical protein